MWKLELPTKIGHRPNFNKFLISTARANPPHGALGNVNSEGCMQRFFYKFVNKKLIKIWTAELDAYNVVFYLNMQFSMLPMGVPMNVLALIMQNYAKLCKIMWFRKHKKPGSHNKSEIMKKIVRSRKGFIFDYEKLCKIMWFRRHDNNSSWDITLHYSWDLVI